MLTRIGTQFLKFKEGHTMEKISLITTIFAITVIVSYPVYEANAQKDVQDSAKTYLEDINNKIHVLQNQLGEGRIILKDKSIYKKTKIHKIHPYWVEYIKDGSLHDFMIEKIERIEIGNDAQKVIVFNDKNEPIIY